MVRSLAKSPSVLLALGFWILACTASLAEGDDPTALNQQVYRLVEQGKYKEAIPIAEKVVEIAMHSQGLESPATADALSVLGLLWNKVGDYAKAEQVFQEALRIRQKVLGSENPDTAESLNYLGGLSGDGRVRQSRTASSASASDPAEGSWDRASLHGIQPG